MAAGGGRVPVFVNARAGRAGAEAVERVHRALEEAGVDADVRPTPPDRLAAEVRAAAEAGAPVIAVAGGDGTLSTAAGALVGRSSALAPIPTGTLNHFARRLGVETPADAARALARPRILTVPVGTVDGQAFLNNAVTGLYPRMVRHRGRLQRYIGKPLATVLGWVYVLARLRHARITLEAHGRRVDRAVVGVWIGLGRGSFRLPGDDAGAEDARVLELVVPRARSRLALLGLTLRTLWRLRWGNRPEGRGLDVMHAPAFRLDARKPVDLARDGEPERLAPPLEFRVVPEGLRVVVEDREGGTA